MLFSVSPTYLLRSAEVRGMNEAEVESDRVLQRRVLPVPEGP